MTGWKREAGSRNVTCSHGPVTRGFGRGWQTMEPVMRPKPYYLIPLLALPLVGCGEGTDPAATGAVDTPAIEAPGDPVPGDPVVVDPGVDPVAPPAGATTLQ